MPETYRDAPPPETAICAAPECTTAMTKPLKQHGKPGDTVVCALPGCDTCFVLKESAPHQLYCTRSHRNVAAKAARREREAAVPKQAKRMRKPSDWLGGTTGDGSLVCGTAILGKREAIDVRHPPQDDARFW